MPFFDDGEHFSPRFHLHPRLNSLLTVYYVMVTNITTVNAIVFLAPISAFDQTLVEAPDVNRLVGKYIHHTLIYVLTCD